MPRNTVAANPEKVLALRKAHAAEHKKYMVIYNKENRDSLIREKH